MSEEVLRRLLGGLSLVFQIHKQTIVEVFACLGSSHGFLSMIFGILNKFWILKIFIRKTYFIFRIEKNLEKVRNLEKVGIFRNFKDFQWVSLVIY